MAIGLCSNGHAVPPALDQCRVCGAPRGAPPAPTPPPGQQLCGSGHASPIGAPFCAICFQPFGPSGAPVVVSHSPIGSAPTPSHVSNGVPPLGRQLSAEAAPPGFPGAAPPGQPDRTGLIIAVALSIVGVIALVAPAKAPVVAPPYLKAVGRGAEIEGNCGRPITPYRPSEREFFGEAARNGVPVAGAATRPGATDEDVQKEAAAVAFVRELHRRMRRSCDRHIRTRQLSSVVLAGLGWSAFFVLRRRGA